MKKVTLSEALDDSTLIEEVKSFIGTVSRDKNGLATPNTSLMYRLKANITLEDCNTTTQGLYRCRLGQTANLPTGTNSTWSILISLIAYEGTAYIIQFLCELSSNGMYYRKKVDADWFAWRKFTFMD